MTGTLTITGAGGFLGAAAVSAATRRGWRVRAVLRDAARAATAPWAGDPMVETVGLDLAAATAEEFARLLDGAGAVVHAAATLSGDDDAHARNTVAPTEALLAAAARTKPAFVLVGSISVYGCAAMPSGGQLDETSPLETETAMRDAYCRAKLAQERATMRAAQRDGLRVRVLRPGVIFGPGRLWTARLGLSAGPVALRIGNGPVPAVEVADCADALIRAAETPPTRNDIPVPNGEGAWEAINVVADDQPAQVEWLATMRVAGWPKGVVSVPLRLAGMPARLAGLAALAAPSAVARLPGLLRTDSFEARFRPLRVSNARLKDRLGWRQSRPILDALASFSEGSA